MKTSKENVFESFNNGSLLLPEKEQKFNNIAWSKHPVFDGVELKHLITSADTNGEFSYHLVKIAPNKSIANHTHEKQLETHEVIDGSGICINEGKELNYQIGVISILKMGTQHEVIACNDGLYLFAKFIPALC